MTKLLEIKNCRRIMLRERSKIRRRHYDSRGGKKVLQYMLGVFVKVLKNKEIRVNI